MKRDKTILLLLPVLLAAFGFGVVRLFQLRFESGDVYPPYSSLRADPLGTRAFYESLENLRGITVKRFIQEFDRLGEGRDTTLFVFGADATGAERSTEHEYKKMEQFMFAGGRIVISFAPLNTRPWAARRDEAREIRKQKPSRRRPGKSDEPDEDKPEKPPAGEEEDWPGGKRISLTDRWHVGLAYENLPKDAADVYQSVIARKKADLNLPESIVWHSALYFDKPGREWNVIYARDKHPVLIERKFGRGAFVFSADSYFLSNEAMRRHRHPELLAWLVGPNTAVLFDETHLNVRESPGVAALVRKYRLHGLVMGLALLAGLFIWKNAVSFVPADGNEAVEARRDAVAGKDSAAGFVNLLRRSIPASEILSVCFAEWKKGRTQGRTGLSARSERVAAVMAEEQARLARDRDAFEGYRRISLILSERK
ncbi:MAG TPA: DUF4350 domain-containing protein [Haliangiales bacterium]|nr:DUF4350 domain-containing protein [Haliangiales bacterium]